MRLHGLVFIIIGAAVAIASWVLTQQGQKMTLFLFVGVAMVLFGAFRLATDKAVKPAKEEARLSHHGHTHLPHHHKTGICASCGTRNHSQANFCGHCGARL